MTSRKSLQNNFGYAYRSGLRDNSLFAILNTVFLSLFFVVMPITTFRNNTSTDRQTGQVSVVNFKEQFSFLFTQSMEMFRYIVIAGLIGVGLLVGITTFKFITGKKTVNVYYSLGIKRQKLFAAKYLSGLTLIALSVLLPMLVSLIVNISVLGTNKFMFPAFAYLTLGMFSVAAVSYTITAMVFTLVGTVFEGALFSGILILFPEILFQCLEVLIQKLVLGTPLGTDFSTSSIYVGDTAASLAKTFENFNPLRYLSKGLFTYSLADAKGQVVSYDNGGAVAWSAPKFLPIVLWIAFAALLFLGGMFFYKRRKAEIGGFIGKNRVMNFIGIFLIGIFGFVLTFNVLHAKGMAVAIAVGAVVFAVIYVGLSFLLLRNVRQFVKELPALPVQLAIVAVIFVFFATGYFGAANKIPETADIQSAQITMPNTNYTTVNTGGGGLYFMMGMPSANTQPYGEYTSEKDIDFVRSVHEKLVETGKTEATKLDSEFNGTYPISVKIVYKLKNGKEVLRCYYGVSAEILKELQKADKTDYQQSVYKKIFKDEVKVVEMPKETEGVPAATWKAYEEYLYIRRVREDGDVRLYNKTLSTETKLELTAEQREKLLDCLYKDLSAQTAQNRYNPAETLGVISFVNSEVVEMGDTQTVIMQNGSVTEEYADSVMPGQEEVFSGKSIYYSQPDFFITSDMTNTVEFLKSVGYYDAIVGDKELKAVYGIQVAQMFTRSYLDNWIYNHTDFACEFLSESSTGNHYDEITAAGSYYDESDRPHVFNSTDKALLEEIRKNTVTRAMLSPTDYIVVFAYADGTYVKTYVHADKMPESAKEGIAKNAPADSFSY